MESIKIMEFLPKIYHLWDKQWFLLYSGDFEKKHFNTMTVSWGYFGIMWNKPIAVVVVRPTRFTFEFMEKYDTFTLSSFNKSYKKDLNILGSKSGRDGDKIAETKLTVVPSTLVAAPTFKEAELIVECRKIYADDFEPENF
ncbi:MAG TPA: flavin reductase, partial [Bacteroidales bacterium]